MYENISNLGKKIKAAIRSRSKNVNLSIDEANLLMIEITGILNSKIESDKKLIDKLENDNKSGDVISGAF